MDLDFILHRTVFPKDMLQVSLHWQQIHPIEAFVLWYVLINDFAIIMNGKIGGIFNKSHKG